ncbi:MAG: putative inorganic carbon transporter subunit DabA, partial [Dokdonella sp.]
MAALTASPIESATRIVSEGAPAHAGTSAQVLGKAIANACDQIAPLWPLKNFVAVNPFLGFSDQTFESTCATMRRVAGVDMLMPRSFYRDALACGVMT